jgi:uncharacterized membrane protein YfcA
MKNFWENKMLQFTVVIMFAFAAGFVQAVSGFGSAIVMMLGFPSVFQVSEAVAISSSVSLVNNIGLAAQFRRSIDIKSNWVPIAIYTTLGFSGVILTKYIYINLLGFLYGVFLVFLATYFFCIRGRKLRIGTLFMLTGSIISGIGTGLFSIGGPMMAMYYTHRYSGHEKYMANVQITFLLGNMVSMMMRVVNGIYTLHMLPFTAAGIIAVLIGQKIGVRLSGKLNPAAAKIVIYLFVAASGILTVIKYAKLL